MNKIKKKKKYSDNFKSLFLNRGKNKTIHAKREKM